MLETVDGLLEIMYLSVHFCMRLCFILCSFTILLSLRSYNRATRMHSAYYAVARCLSVLRTQVFCQIKSNQIKFIC